MKNLKNKNGKSRKIEDKREYSEYEDNDRLTEIFQNLSDKLGVDNSVIISLLQGSTDKQNEIIEKIEFIPVALLIGLLLRKPCMKIIAFFNRRVEESNLMV